MGTFLHLAILDSGNKLWGIDSFGWGVIIFLLLLLGIPYSRYFLRKVDLEDWPIISATIRKTEVVRGAPREINPPIANAVASIPQLIPYHCRAMYVFLIDGALYEGQFAMVATGLSEAESFAEALKGQQVLVKYNPRNPKDSDLEDQRILGRKVIQEDTQLLNPKVW